MEETTNGRAVVVTDAGKGKELFRHQTPDARAVPPAAVRRQHRLRQQQGRSSSDGQSGRRAARVQRASVHVQLSPL